MCNCAHFTFVLWTLVLKSVHGSGVLSDELLRDISVSPAEWEVTSEEM